MVNIDDNVGKAVSQLRRGRPREEVVAALKDYLSKLDLDNIDEIGRTIMSQADMTVNEKPPEPVGDPARLLDLIDEMDADARPLGLTPERREEIVQWVKARITEPVLQKLNKSFVAMNQRNLTYSEIAVIAAIHRDSVLTNNGDSPSKRFLKFSKWEAESESEDKVFHSALSWGHIRRVLVLLEAIGYTRLVTPHDAKRNKCGTYSVPELDPVPTSLCEVEPPTGFR